MRTALSAFLALVVTFGLFVIMASWVEPRTDSKRYGEWRDAAQAQRYEREWGLYDVIQRYVDTATACSPDSECTIHSFGCPLDCFSVVATDQVELIGELKRAVHQETGLGCIDQCAGPPAGSRAICVIGECRLAMVPGGTPDDDR